MPGACGEIQLYCTKFGWDAYSVDRPSYPGDAPLPQPLALIMLPALVVVRLAIGLSAPERDGRRIATALRVLVIPTRLEPGRLSCTIWTELGEDFRVHYEERWCSEQAMRQRVLSDAFTKLLEVLEASPRPPTVEFDFVSKHMGLDYVEDVRSAYP